MAYFDLKEYEDRIRKVREIIGRKNLDCALIYHDEFSLANDGGRPG